MQNIQYKIKNAEEVFAIRILHLSFCILHFAFSSQCSLCLCGYFFFWSTSVAGAPQEVVLVDGDMFVGELDSVGADGVVVFRRAVPQGPAAEATSPDVVEVKL